MLVAEFTEVFGPIMVLPFVLLLLPMAAVNTLSEGWVWTWGSIALYGGGNLYVLGHALMFQFEAVRAKETVLEELDQYRRRLIGETDGERKLLELVIGEIEKMQKGAFVPWTRHPIVQSVGASVIAIGTMLAALF